MLWDVEFTDGFGAWFGALTVEEQVAISAVVGMLETHGPHLQFPHTSNIQGTSLGGLRELRKQYRGQPYRVLYAFDPRRTALLLIGGNKGGDDRWYERMIPLAEALFEAHLDALKREGLL